MQIYKYIDRTQLILTVVCIFILILGLIFITYLSIPPWIPSVMIFFGFFGAAISFINGISSAADEEESKK